MAKLSAKHALNKREREFCQQLNASEGQFVARAYKAAFAVWREVDARWVVIDDEDIDLDKLTPKMRGEIIARSLPVDAKQLDKKGRNLLKSQLIQSYLRELDGSPVDIAEGIVQEQMVTGDAKESLRAAERTIEDKDRIRKRQMIQHFWEVSAENLADVVRPMPGEVRKLHSCAQCGHEEEVVTPLHARFPAAGDGAAPTYTVTCQDLADGTAFIQYGPEGRIKLLEAAGAPWSDTNPEAKLSERQREWQQHRERIKILHGGSGAGKSVVGAGDCIVATMVPHSIVGAIGAMFDNVEKDFRYIDRGFRKLFPHEEAFVRIACISRHNYHDFEVSTLWGSECFGYSMESNDGRSALGETLHHATICEGAQLSAHIMNTRILRALDRAVMRRPGISYVRETGTLSIPTTPDAQRGAGCAVELINERRRSTKRDLGKLKYGRVPYVSSFWLCESAVTDNPDYNPDVVAERRLTMKKHEFEEVYLGKMTNATGRVYHQFSDVDHVKPMPRREELCQMRFGLGVDTGTTFAAVLAGVAPDKRVWILAEAVTEKETVPASARATIEMLQAVLPYDFKGDVERMMARIDMHIMDPASPVKVDLEECIPGFHFESPTRGQGKFELIPTVSQVGEMFANDRLWVVDSCDWFLDEIRQYVWKSTRSPARQGQFMVREPAKDGDHALDAARYVVIPLAEAGPLDKPTQEDTRDAMTALAHRRIFEPLRKVLDNAHRRGGVWVG